MTQVKEDTVKSCEERVQEVKATKQRLESMLAKVRNWTPPSTDHTNLKDFIERQLVDTITWDGNVTYAEQAVELAKGLDLQQAIVRHREQLLKTIDFMRDHVDKGNVTYGQRQLWLDPLRDSLKGA